MFHNMIKWLVGNNRNRIHSQIVKPLNHLGIYEYHDDYLKQKLKGEQKNVYPRDWNNEQKGA
ncbi:hypothetical protein [Melghirimyces algeriensis]|uniref:Uncharacterized protein n=1 Tax=Melghirimyces algeriensis TaxID=910412 RepID=A0A521BUU2_9BACL|nr:hypothetical protein [Melghirimyces algeriensis]SMO50954.1 hypothetical protein SAMN06264849_102455 [Melghirimyces algeriensis]